MKYAVRRGQIVVKARGASLAASNGATVIWSGIAGTIELDADARSAASAEFVIDMRAFETADRFVDWKLKSALALDEHPTATFRLSRFDRIHEVAPARFEGSSLGHLDWRGHTVDVIVKGNATIDRRLVEASASFDLDVEGLGLSAPKILAFMVDGVVAVRVSIQAQGVG